MTTCLKKKSVYYYSWIMWNVHQVPVTIETMMYFNEGIDVTLWFMFHPELLSEP